MVKSKKTLNKKIFPTNFIDDQTQQINYIKSKLIKNEDTPQNKHYIKIPSAKKIKKSRNITKIFVDIEVKNVLRIKLK